VNWKRILALVVTAPVWLLLGVYAVVCCLVMFPIVVLVSFLAYGFTGRWKMPWPPWPF